LSLPIQIEVELGCENFVYEHNLPYHSIGKPFK
jgi:hypothetical protein